MKKCLSEKEQKQNWPGELKNKMYCNKRTYVWTAVLSFILELIKVDIVMLYGYYFWKMEETKKALQTNVLFYDLVQLTLNNDNKYWSGRWVKASEQAAGPRKGERNQLKYVRSIFGRLWLIDLLFHEILLLLYDMNECEKCKLKFI